MLVEKLSQNGSLVEYKVVASIDEYRNAARNGVRTFLLQAGAPIPDEDKIDEILSHIMGADANLDEVKRELAANYLVPRAVQQAEVMPICSPDFTPIDTPEDGEEFELRMRVCPKPELELTNYGPVAIEVDAPKVTEEEIDAQVRELMRAHGNRNVGLDGAGVVATPAEPNLDDLDDEWVAKHIPDDAINTVEQMRSAIRKAGEQQKSADFENYKLSVAAAEMAQRLEEEIPADVIEAMSDSMMGELRAQAANQGVTVDDLLSEHGMTEDDMVKRAREEAEGMLRQGLALDAVFRHENLSIEDQDRTAALHAIAPGAEEDAAKQLEESGYAFTIEETASRLRAGRWILEHAEVTVRA